MWWELAIFALSLIISYTNMPKPQSVPPAGLNDFRLPTAEIGREIPVLFGTKKIEGANVVWYGDLRSTPIQKKGGKK